MANSRFGYRRDIGCLAALASSGETVHRRGAGAADHRAGPGGRSVRESKPGRRNGRRRQVSRAEDISRGRMAAVVSSTFAVAVYGGYFTAAQGILLVGAMGALLPESVQRMNAAKNLLTLIRESCCSAGLYDGGLPSNQLGGRWSHRDRVIVRRLAGCTLWPSAVTECAARRDRHRRPHRALPAAHRLTGQPRLDDVTETRIPDLSAIRCGK